MEIFAQYTFEDNTLKNNKIFIAVLINFYCNYSVMWWSNENTSGTNL